jgi:hypothetical protein
MAKAIQCDVCGKTETKDRAFKWQTLRLNISQVVSGSGACASNEADGLTADLCSSACAASWFEHLLFSSRAFR